MDRLIDIIAPTEQEGTKAIVAHWVKQVGDTITLDEPLLELETDKVTQEIPSPATGRLAEILLAVGADVPTGAVLGRIDTAAGDTAAGDTDSQSGADAPKTPDAVHAVSPDTSGPDPTSKSTVQPAVAGAASAPPHTPSPSAADPFSHRALARYSPAVRQAAQALGIDPATVQGTGRGGRVTRADMQAAAARQTDSSIALPIDATVAPAAPAARIAPASDGATAPPSGRSHIVPHTAMRQAIARHMAASVATAPHVTAVFEADFTQVIRHREHHKAAFAANGIPLSYTAYLVAASVAAMRAVPAINSRWHDDGLEIFDDVHIGIGIALDNDGLIVPVIHRAQEASLAGIARRLQDITHGAHHGTLSRQDVQGGTFTISNHGTSGSLFAAPIIINQPQSAILGVGKIEKRAVAREIDGIDTLQIRPMAYVSLTIDHRALDGQQTNAWLTRFVQEIEHWPL
ncbi:dihydrolipoamide acetyltransferase family protein [Castellaniella hirudinis]|uniref:dihydrolipoamide acetyltransferase family protein n=1 Tax=Castellaniella hirudinis TaxID=1144617 RepID=UPI0039C44FF2